jgi:hypothetical protein
MGDRSIGIFSGFLINIILILILTFGFLLKFFEYESYKKYDCNIVRISYPIVIPSISTNNWMECDCGDDCISYNYCMKLFAEMSPDNFIRDQFMTYNTVCTFQNNNCDKNANFQNILNEVQIIYNNYINRSNVNCYYNDDNDYIYLNKGFPYVGMIITCIITIITQLLIICCISC